MPGRARLSIRGRAALTAGISLVSLAIFATPAHADCPAGSGSFCYAYVDTGDTATYNGVSATLNWACMSQPTVLVTQQSWLATDPVDAWIEAGIYKGNLAGGAGLVTTPTVFWGRKYSAASGGTYQTWKSGATTAATPYNFSIVRNSGGFVWQIFQGSGIIGNANAPANTMGWAAAGAESHDPSDKNTGSMSAGKVMRNSSTWSAGFGPSWSWFRTAGYFSVSSYTSSSMSYSTGC